MNTATQGNLGLLYRVMTAAALVLIVIAYFSPIWWVSLRAPQYPDSAFPQGIRIHFHVDGVFNGCQKVVIKERADEAALNCKHEMDTINHYVGMYPIAAGGPVERVFSPFLFSWLVLCGIAFTLSKRTRVVVLAAGSAAIAAWMSYALFVKGGYAWLSPGYIADASETLDLTPKDYATWSGLMGIEESYTEALGRYFRIAKEIGERVDLMLAAAKVVYVVVLVAMAALVVAVWKLPIAYWALALLPALVSVAFIVEYSAWLWWFGHSLSNMAAFSLKPFMPTVFGQGKVAQFATYSYPHYGFGLFAAATVLLLLAMLFRRKQLMQSPE